MSSPASLSSAGSLPEEGRELVPAPVSAPDTTLPLRPQAARAGARHWVPADPEILRRGQGALAHPFGRYLRIRARLKGATLRPGRRPRAQEHAPTPPRPAT